MAALDLRGGALAWREEGAGPPMMLVHGSPGDGKSWARVAPHLAAKFRLVIPDLPGYGGSPALAPDVADRTAEIGRTLAGLITSCGEPVRLAAHSYGGNVALHAALLVPDRIRGLALFEPVFLRALALAGQDALLAQAREFFLDYVRRVEASEPDAVGRMIDYWFGAGAFPRLPPAVQNFLRGAAPRNAVDVRATFEEQISLNDFNILDSPVTIAYGGASPPVAPAVARALAAMLPAARAVAIPGASHGMLDTHPKEVATLAAA